MNRTPQHGMLWRGPHNMVCCEENPTTWYAVNRTPQHNLFQNWIKIHSSNSIEGQTATTSQQKLNLRTFWVKWPFGTGAPPNFRSNSVDSLLEDRVLDGHGSVPVLDDLCLHFRHSRGRGSARHFRHSARRPTDPGLRFLNGEWAGLSNRQNWANVSFNLWKNNSTMNFLYFWTWLVKLSQVGLTEVSENDSKYR